MSRKIESRCVGCDLPCIHNACPYYQCEVSYCDDCGDEAEYEFDGDDYCGGCIETYLKKEFDSLSVEEKAQCLDVDIKRIGG